jgi:hypothetical protein
MIATVRDPSAEPARRRNHAIWLGPAVTFCGAVSYFTVFVTYPGLRDFPWVNLPLVLVGVALSSLGLWRAFRRSSVFGGKRLGAVGFTLSLFLGGLFFFYVFLFSYQLPGPTPTSQTLSDIQDFDLIDHRGRAFRLGELRGRKVVLIFYRGHW